MVPLALSTRSLARRQEDRSAITLMFFDACRDNSVARERRGRTRGLAPITADENTLMVYATHPGDVAYDGEGENSPFARGLLSAIETPAVPIEFAMKEVTRSVQAERADGDRGKQSPWIEGLLVNTFFFEPPS